MGRETLCEFFGLFRVFTFALALPDLPGNLTKDRKRQSEETTKKNESYKKPKE